MPAQYNDPNIVRCTLAQYKQLLNGETVKGHTLDKTKYVYVIEPVNLYQHNIVLKTSEASEPECCSFQLINDSSEPLNTYVTLKTAMQVNKHYAAHGFVYEMLMLSGDSEVDFPIITSIYTNGTNIFINYFSKTDDGTTLSAGIDSLLGWSIIDNVVQIQ